jgi:putative two-component system response regulator
MIRTAPARVLIVDDEPANRQLLKRALEKEGYHTDEADSGEGALRAVRGRPPDLILLDVQLPGLGGFDVCEALKQDSTTRLIPIVLITGLTDRANRIQGIRAGADDFLTKPFDSHELQARVGSLIRLKRYTDELDSAESVIRSLALTIEARDAYTDGHCERLAQFAVALGQGLQLSSQELLALDRGGYLHDLGKIGVPDAILLKPAPLDAAELAIMRQHTIIGDRLCGQMRSLKLVRQVVRHHHELYDGSGYPDGLRGEEIPLLAQIVGIVDLYDAVTTTRPYRPALPPAHAFVELENEVSRGLRRPDLVARFISLMGEGKVAARVHG